MTKKERPVCAVCGQGGYWIGWLGEAQGYRCPNHLTVEESE